MFEKKLHLLLVDDEEAFRQVQAESLEERGFIVDQAETGERAVQRLTEMAYDIVITDLRLPGIPGTEVLARARERYPEIIVFMITGYGTIKDAVEAMKNGAADFIEKPFQTETLIQKLKGPLENRGLRSENEYLRSQLRERYSFSGMVGRSPAMRALFDTLETVAKTTSTILISGESGTGKELVARAIHYNSPRHTERFVALNCGAIPETLQEAELFGHVRGAFTGAVGSRQGRLEQAHRGTLFLDETGTMSPALQMKLLRVLQEREFERVGSSQTTKVDVRVIAATNRDLGKMVETGEFREDLYYRLNVIPIELPPLRNRREDVPLLVSHFLASLDRSDGDGEPTAPSKTVSQAAMRLLQAYHWPGNVRQLQNAMERAVALSAGQTIDAEDLPAELRSVPAAQALGDLTLPEEGLDLGAHLEAIERDFIRRALDRSGGKKEQASRLLNLKRTTLVEKLKRLERGQA